MSRAVIAIRLELKIFLMVVLGIIPLCCSGDLCGDRLSLIPFLPNLRFDLICDLELLIILGEDRRPILCACICTLSVQCGWIMHLEKVFHQLAVADFVWIKGNQEGLSMASTTGASIGIGGIVSVSSCVSDSAIKETLALAPVLAIKLLQSPEAAPGEDGTLCVGRKLHRGQGIWLQRPRHRRRKRSD